MRAEVNEVRFDRWVAGLGGYGGQRFCALQREALEFAGPAGYAAYLDMARQIDESWRPGDALIELAATGTVGQPYSWDDLAKVIELVGDGHGHHVPGTPYVYRHWWVPLDGTELGDDGIRRPAKDAEGKAEPAAAAAVRRAVTGRAAARGEQSWPLSRVGRLTSGNEQGLTVAQEYHRKEILGRYSPTDRERARQAGFEHPRDYQRHITEDIRRRGMINPVRASYGALDEGYHRYAAMRQLGRRQIKVRRGGLGG
jgi:hypothetical protein